MNVFIITVPERMNHTKCLRDKLSYCECINNVKVLIDFEHNGPWWNTERAIRQIAESGEAGIVLQDDALIDKEMWDHHIKVIESHLSKFGMISMFTPPQALYDKINQDGEYNGTVGDYFMWAVCYMINPLFAKDIIEESKHIDESKAKYHDEVRVRFAAQRKNWSIAILSKSIASHNLHIKSTLGTPAKIGNLVRDTRTLMTKSDDYSELKLKKHTHKQDWMEFAK